MKSSQLQKRVEKLETQAGLELKEAIMCFENVDGRISLGQPGPYGSEISQEEVLEMAEGKEILWVKFVAPDPRVLEKREESITGH